jgi:hypothetical protein
VLNRSQLSENESSLAHYDEGLSEVKNTAPCSVVREMEKTTLRKDVGDVKTTMRKAGRC